MCEITGVARYKPKIEWSDKSWTHNVFRFYELLFWRRFGIRAEMSSGLNAEGKQFYVCYSWESAIALTETYIREFLSSWRLAPVRISIPVMKTPEGFPFFASPYVFAIAYDNSTLGGSIAASPKTFSHTCTGSDLILVVTSQSNPASVTAVSYNSASLTQQVQSTDTGAYLIGLWTKTSPSTGSNTVSLTAANNLTGGATSYSGAPGGVDNVAAVYNGTPGESNPVTISVTSIADNCWGVCAHVGVSATIAVASTGTTQRGGGNLSGGTLFGDSNSAKTPAGSISMAVTYSDFPFAGRYGVAVAITISPTAGGGGGGGAAVVHPTLLLTNAG